MSASFSASLASGAGATAVVVKTQENRHKRAAGVISATAVRGKKMKFE